MSLKLDVPPPIAAYFEATAAGDVDAKLALFDENAGVTDEGKHYIGRAAIRSWVEDTARRYRYTVGLREVTTTDARTVVSAKLTGDFPGSPVLLDFTFTLAGPKISGLEIG